jgi:hypothetical protein
MARITENKIQGKFKLIGAKSIDTYFNYEDIKYSLRSIGENKLLADDQGIAYLTDFEYFNRDAAQKKWLTRKEFIELGLPISFEYSGLYKTLI